MNGESSIGDSKKKGIATGAITALAAFHSETNSIYVIVAITVIAIWGMSIFGLLEYPKKKIKSENISIDKPKKPGTI